MENKDLISGTGDLLGSSHSQVAGAIKREIDSLDDFEHLGHDSSPVKDLKENLGKVLDVDSHARDIEGIINKGVESSASTASKLADELIFDPIQKTADSAFNTAAETLKMDSNLLDLGDSFPDRKEADAKLDKFLSDMSSFAPPTTQKIESPVKPAVDEIKAATQFFMDTEREELSPVQPPKKMNSDEFLDHYSDSEPEEEDFKHADDDFRKSQELPEFSSKTDTFKDLEDFDAKFDETLIIPEPSPEPVKTPEPTPEPVLTPEPVKTPEPKPSPPTPEPVIEKPAETKKEEPKIATKSEPIKTKTQIIEAEAMFCKMGLDAWFNPERLNPNVESLIYWRDPKKSGPVFGGVLLILLSLKFFSLISVVAYVSLIGLTATISFRIYKNIVQAVQKTGDGHPFKDYLETDVALPQDKVEDITKVAVAHLNAALVELRRLFLVEDLVDSIKFGVLLWCFTYLGAWFNGITLIILAWVALFSLPKVYETNKTQIDANLDIVRSKLAEITSKVKAAVPIGKKTEEKKE